MEHDEMIVPSELLDLIASGKWPRSAEGINGRDKAIWAQESNPLISEEQVKSFAFDEKKILLFPPPFTSLQGHVAPSALESFLGAPDPLNPPGDLDFKRCLDIGDFGIGSESPIVLDYRAGSENPTVLRLRWRRVGTEQQNRWVMIAPNFRDFAKLLGFIE